MFKGVLALAAMVLFAATSAQAITLEEIIANNLDARGGREMITKIKTMKVSGTMETMGGELTFTQYLKNNTKLRMEMTVQGMDIVQAFDGITGWSTNPMTGAGPQRSSKEETNQARGQANIWGEFINPEDQGLTLEYVGAEDIDGMTAYKIKVTDPDGNVHHSYVDAITWLEVKVTRTISMMGQESEMDIFLSNYKDIGGVQYPMQMDMEMEGQTVMSMKRENVEVNIEMPDDLFAFPGE